MQSFDWSKDGRSIAFTANPPERKNSKDRKEKYSDYEVFEKDYQAKPTLACDVAAAERLICLPQPSRSRMMQNSNVILRLLVAGFSKNRGSSAMRESAAGIRG